MFHSYSLQNILLILSQHPDATRVAGFHAWKKLGRSVKKGEKGLMIFAPMLVKRKDGDSETADDSEPTRVLRFRVVHVFDISQTEGDPLPELSRAGGDPGKAMQRLEAAIVASGIDLATVDDLGGAQGVSRGGRIEVVGSLSPAERFCVLVHEYAHELLHKVAAEDRPSKAVRETEAEAVAYVVCESVGLSSGSASVDYIKLYRGDTETLASSLGQIRDAASRIIGEIETPGQPSSANNRPVVPGHFTPSKSRV